MHTSRLLFLVPLVPSCLLLAPAAAQTIAPTWIAQLDGAAHYDDFGTAGVVLPSGDVAVAGTAFWEPQQGLFVPQFFTALYSSQGVELWSKFHGSGFYGGNGAADHIGIAPGNKLVVAGQRDLGADWLVVQYDLAGQLQWEAIWAAGSYFVSSPADMAIDAFGNTYLCGDIGDPATGPTTAVVKISPTGALLWSRLYDGTGLAVHAASSIVTDASGAVFITGETTDSGGVMQFSVSRLDPANGAPMWMRNHAPTGTYSSGLGRKIGIDGAGHLIAAGEIADGPAGTYGWSFVSYATDGTQLWLAEHAVPAGSVAGISDLAVNSTGDAAAAGWVFDMTTGNVDWLVVRVSGGQVAWANGFGGSALFDDRAMSAAIDAQGNVYAGGYTMDPERTFDVRAYDASGNLSAVARGLAPAQGSGYPRSMALGQAGRVYVMGDFAPFPLTGGDAVTLAFDMSVTQTYCTAKTNSQGCVPQIASIGVPSATAGSGFVIRGSNVLNNKSGVLLYGITGQYALPFLGGTLCVKSPKRSASVNSGGNPPPNDCSGIYSLDMNCFATAGCGGNPLPALSLPGTIVDCQWWGRDPGFPAPTGISLTDALEYTVLP